MLPLRDENPTRHRPWATMTLIAANVAAFLFQLSLPGLAQGTLLQTAALIPARLQGSLVAPGLWPPATLVTSQFLHGGVLHIGGNMLFLWIFGNNVEDRLRPARYLLFYLLCGVAAGLVHTLIEPGSRIPTVGASGAISGVLGAYALLYPRARVHTLVPLLFAITVIRVPALLWVAIWLLVQLLQGIASGGSGGGVAWFAHVGGLLGGALLLPLLLPRKRRRRRFTSYGGTWD